MKARIAAVVLLLLLALLLWLRGSGRDELLAGDKQPSAARGTAAASEDNTSELADADAKSADRKTLREMLPADTEIEADEMRDTFAKGNVCIKLSHGVECWADQISVGTEKNIYIMEGRVLIWTDEGKGCMIRKTGPLKLRLDENDKTVINTATGSIEFHPFDEPQTAEQRRAFRDSLKEEAR